MKEIKQLKKLAEKQELLAEIFDDVEDSMKKKVAKDKMLKTNFEMHALVEKAKLNL